MALNNSKDAQIIYRRSRVASLLLRGATQREIMLLLEQQAVLNPETMKPYSLGTINSDIKDLKKKWRDSSQGDIIEHQARIWAEIQEVKRLAWSNNDGKLVLQALKQEAELIGANKPVGLDLTSGGSPLKFTTVEVVKDYGTETGDSDE